ncbi:MAG TPA: RagB/SusD family nutrient uptake outer membrane protein [Chryseolinea sp.]
MKKITNYILAIILSFGGISCGDEFLDVLPQDQSVLDDYFNDEVQIQSVTGSLYSRPWFNFNDKFSWAAGDGMAGDLYNDYQDEGQLFFFTYSATNSIIYNAWISLYDVITIANTIITDMPRIASKNGVAEDVINRGLGEAHFMRAAAYFFLTEFWGDVPIVENPVEKISSNDMNLPRNTQSSVYEFIRRDLAFAAENLPQTNAPGRVTSWSAKGMLAKLHVTLGHFNKSQADFNTAKGYALDVIENSGLTLMANYGDLFRIANNNNPESLFALQWSNNNWGVGNSRQAVFGRNSIVTGNDEAWGGGKSATYSFIENMVANAGTDGQGQPIKDPRMREIVMTLGETYPEMHNYTYNIVTPNPDGGGDLEYKAPLLNNLKKYIVGTQDDVGVPIKNQGVPLNQYMLRLADVYLLYAEAEIGLGAETNNAKALELFNKVRTRGNGVFGKLAPRTSLTFEQLMNERRVEFGIEGIAWYDVKRRYYRDEGAAINYLNSQNRAVILAQKDGWQGDRNVYDAYELEQPATPVTVTGNSFRLPIPGDEAAINPRFADEPVDYVFE